MTGNKTAENGERSFNFTLTFAQLENVGADFQALSSLHVHRYTVWQSSTSAGEPNFPPNRNDLQKRVRQLGHAHRISEIECFWDFAGQPRTAGRHLLEEERRRRRSFPRLRTAVSFDANSAALVIGTPMRNYQKMSAKVRFVLDKPQKTFHLVVKKNQHQMELGGRAEAELKVATTLAGLESAVAAGRYDFSSRKTLSLKLSLNDKTVQVGGSLEGLKISIKATDYRKIQLNGDVQLTAQTSTLPLDVGNGRKAFPSHRIAHWPQIGRPDQHALHRIGNDGHERPLERTPVAGPSHVPC